MWNQQSRNTWLVSADRNTGFFHVKASNRFQRNTIKGLCDETGAWHEEDIMVENIVVGYFNSIFQSNEQCDATEVVEAIQPVVSSSMNSSLSLEFKAKEVTRALKQMHPKKASRPDGMPPFFYQHYWSFIGNYVTQVVLDFLNHGIIPSKFNEPILPSSPR